MNRYAVVIIYRDNAGVLQVGQSLVPDYEQAEILALSYPNVISVTILPWLAVVRS